MKCPTCGRPKNATFLLHVGECDREKDVNCWRARAEALEAERDALEGLFREAVENGSFSAEFYSYLRSNLARIDAAKGTL